MKTHVGLEEKIIENLRSIFSRYSNIEKVVLYGSRALGTHKPTSDIDLCVFAKDMDLGELLRIENEIDDLLMPYKVDLSLFDKIENDNLVDHINRVGIIFFRK